VPCYENGPSNVSIANVPVNNDPVDDGSVDITAVNDNPTPTVDSTNNVPDGITVDNHEVSVDTTTGAMNDRSTPINPATSQIKPGIKVRYRDYADQPTHEGIVTTRAGKARGVNRHWWNTTRPNGTSHAVDFNAVHEWEIIPQDNLDQEQGQETLVNATLLTINKSRELDAKKIELEQWKTMDVYQEVDDIGQDCMSLRWVMKEKINDNGNKTMKARLCVRGFEEELTFRTDSPTCSREGIRLFLSTTASKGWTINTIDVKGAFLQGKKLDREVLIRPPKEAETTKLWSQQK
jgi:hypothetical protein